jgi:antitoxin (DNA-binding transcriptional repressor) of toxin-antitoxin stability system
MKPVEITQDEAVLKHIPQIGDGPVALIVDGKPVAVIVPVEDMDLESVSLAFGHSFYELIEQSCKSIKEGGIPFEEVRRQFGHTKKMRARRKKILRKTKAVPKDEEYDMESIGLANNPSFREIIESSIKSIEVGPNLTIDEMREKYNIPRKQPRARKKAG